MDDTRDAFATSFGPIERDETSNLERRRTLFLVARQLAWIRDYTALENPNFDTEPNQRVQLRIGHAHERNGPDEEWAYALEGVRPMCEVARSLTAPEGRRAADTCLELLDELPSPRQ